jgi:pantothenate kinase
MIVQNVFFKGNLCAYKLYVPVKFKNIDSQIEWLESCPKQEVSDDCSTVTLLQVGVSGFHKFHYVMSNTLTRLHTYINSRTVFALQFFFSPTLFSFLHF